MEKVSINLQNCFGIDNLQYEFDFTKDSTYAIIMSPKCLHPTTKTRRPTGIIRKIIPNIE